MQVHRTPCAVTKVYLLGGGRARPTAVLKSRLLVAGASPVGVRRWGGNNRQAVIRQERLERRHHRGQVETLEDSARRANFYVPTEWSQHRSSAVYSRRFGVIVSFLFIFSFLFFLC